IELKELDEKHRKELKKLAKEHQSKIQAIQSEIEGYTSEIDRLRKKVSGLISAQLHDKQKIKQLEDINHELREELFKTDQRDISQKSTIDTLKSEISRIEKESTEKDQALEEANSDILKRRAEIEELKRSMKQRDKEIQEAGEELSGMTEDRDYLQDELLKEKKKVRLAEEMLLSTEERASRLEQELNEKKQAYDRLKEETEIALANMEREARKSSSEYENHILELTSALKEKSQKVLELEEENRILRERVETQDKELEELQKEVKLLRKENRELWSILERLATILNVTFNRDNLETTGQSILEGIKTSAFAKGALGEIAAQIGLNENAEMPAIHERLEELIQIEGQFDLLHKEKQRALEELEAISRSIEVTKPLCDMSVSASSSELSGIQQAFQEITSAIMHLTHGLGKEQVYLSGLNSQQEEVLRYNRNAILNPNSILHLEKQVTSIVSKAKGKAESSNHKGFNAIIYDKNNLLDFIDRIHGFFEKNNKHFRKIDAYQTQLKALIERAKSISEQGLTMKTSDLRELQATIKSIHALKKERQVLIQSLVIALIDAIRFDSIATKNRYTGQLATGSGFPMFGKDLMAYFQAFQKLDPSYYIDGNPTNPLIDDCHKAEEFRMLVTSLQGSLGALFAKITI
ncbi:MAG: hypothetical protein KDK59_08830, partial [Simkania sp.]|nr:hypothetical protein [Simkania sp.]